MGGTCGMRGRDEKYTQFAGKREEVWATYVLIGG